MQILNGRRYRVEQLAFSHCGRWLAAAGAGGLHVWDTSNPTAKPRHPEGTTHYHDHIFGFRPNGRLLFSDGRHHCHHYNPTLPGEHPEPLGDLDWACVLSPDGERAVGFSSGWRKPNLFRTWLITAGGKPLAGESVAIDTNHVFCLAFSPDGKTVAAVEGTLGGRDPHLVFRSPVTLEETLRVPSAYREPTQLLFSPDGAKLVARSAGGFACWNVAELSKAPRKAANPSRKHFLSMAFHPDGKLLTVDNERMVRVWDIATLKPDRAIEWNVGKLHAVTVSPDGTRAAVGSGTGKVLVWDWD